MECVFIIFGTPYNKAGQFYRISRQHLLVVDKSNLFSVQVSCNGTDTVPYAYFVESNLHFGRYGYNN